MDRVTFRTRRFLLTVLAVVLLVAGLSPLLSLLTGPAWWRASLLVVWTLVLCVPGGLVLVCVTHPAELVVDQDGLSCRRAGRTSAWQWTDIERVAVLGAHRSGLAPRFVFVRTATSPAGSAFPWRGLSARWNGVIVCDLFSLNATQQRMVEALARFGGDRFDPQFHPDHGLRIGTETTIDGRIVSARTLVASLAVLGASGAFLGILGLNAGPAMLASSLAVTVGIALTVLWVTTPCRLTIDAQGITFRRGRQRTPQVVWTAIRSVGIVRDEYRTTGRPLTAAHLVTVTPIGELRLPGSWLLQERGWSDSRVLCHIDSIVCQLHASAAAIDAELKRFAGDQYHEPMTRPRS